MSAFAIGASSIFGHNPKNVIDGLTAWGKQDVSRPTWLGSRMAPEPDCLVFRAGVSARNGGPAASRALSC